ncbi:MAG: PIN domain-containing protein [Kiritimatiellia bacterium]
MKNAFPGYFKKSDEAIKTLWNDCRFVFDANILLNLYRYSDATREAFFKILQVLKERLWLPHQVGEEFFGGRLNEIRGQYKAYEDMIAEIRRLEQELKNPHKHPFVGEKTLRRTTTTFKQLEGELASRVKRQKCLINDDHILSNISDIFTNKVGSPYDEARLKAIFKEGKERYDNRIPPGYKDAGKSAVDAPPRDLQRRYGDLIIWYQILEYSEGSKRDIVFVTDDTKEDWWCKLHDNLLCPHPELVDEFQKKTGQQIHMYQSDTFIEYAGKYMEAPVQEATISEIRDTMGSTMLGISGVNLPDYSDYAMFIQPAMTYKNLESIEGNISDVRRKLSELSKHQKELDEDHANGQIAGEIYNDACDQIQHEIKMLTLKLEIYEKSFNAHRMMIQSALINRSLLDLQ